MTQYAQFLIQHGAAMLQKECVSPFSLIFYTFTDLIGIYVKFDVSTGRHVCIFWQFGYITYWIPQS